MKVVIVGGVAGGASTAARLRRLDEQAEIVVLERGEQVSYANCGLPYHIGGVIKKRDALFVQTPGKLRLILKIDVRIRSEAIAIDQARKTIRIRDEKTGEEYDESWDKLVLCPGSRPADLGVPGEDLPGVYHLHTVEDMDAIKKSIDTGAKRAIVVGGGFIGVELAENLRECNLHVDLIEKSDHVLPFLDLEMGNELDGHITRNGVRLHLSSSVKSFAQEGRQIVCELDNGTRVNTDFVVYMIGVRPDTALARSAGLEIGASGGIKVDAQMRTSHPDIYAAGDAVEVIDLVTGQPRLLPMAGPANRQGRTIADHLCGREVRFGPVQGTSIVKVFDMTAGATGASERQLCRAGMDYEKIYIHPPGHASYYPGTSAMHLKLLFSGSDGKILGAQLIGFDGVDKRLDVLAVAIRQGLTVYDLEELELAYAPPFGSAKDPVNMAGFVAANLLRGDAPHWYAEDFVGLDDNALVVDVRSETEYENWHLPNAINIPHTCIRDELEDIPTDRKIFLYCRTGFRSYLALRILRQQGYRDVATLSGGAITFSAFSNEIQTGKRLLPEVSYGEERVVELIRHSGREIELDVTRVGYTSPLDLIQQNLDHLEVGDDLMISLSDTAVLSYLPSWCNTYGHVLLDVERSDLCSRLRIRKGGSIFESGGRK